jgi:hypothetical protein
MCCRIDSITKKELDSIIPICGVVVVVVVVGGGVGGKK